ncbi:MAG: amino acid permease [Elusimicrobia bacterium]|nr:amino acid permease [Elusimicrobiota bacterium]
MPDARSRPLSLFDIACIGVNAIVGSSIFLFPGRLAGMLGPASVLSFALSGALLGCVALCFAEASADFDGHGGPYLYARAAFGPSTGYAIGWLCWLAEVLSLSAVADGIAVYLGYFDPSWASPAVVKGSAAFVIVLMGAINYRGVKLGAWTSNAFTLAKLVPLLLFVVVGLPQVKAVHFAPFAPHGWKPMGAACLLTFFAYSGFEVVPVPAGEVCEAKKMVPLATVFSMGVSALLYMAIQAAAVGLHPGLAQSERPLADAAAVALGPWGATLIVIGAVISTAGFCAGCALGGPRYLVALADQGDWPKAFSRRHERFDTPWLAVLATTGLSLAAAMLLDFNKLVDITVVVVCAQYLSTCAAVPIMRRQKTRREGFRLPGGLLLPVIGFVSTLWLGSQASRTELLCCLGMLAAGFALRRGLKLAID